MQPRLLLVWREVVQNFHNVTNHFLTNSADESRAFWRDADHHFAAVVSRSRAHHIAKILQARHETARCRRSVPHFLRDFRHTQHFLAIEIRKKKKLRERNVAGREFVGQMQHKTPLHFQNDVGKPFGIRTNLIRRSSCKRGSRSRVQRGKTRNAREGCQTCSERTAYFFEWLLGTDWQRLCGFAKALECVAAASRRFREMPSCEAGKLKRMGFSHSSVSC